MSALHPLASSCLVEQGRLVRGRFGLLMQSLEWTLRACECTSSRCRNLRTRANDGRDYLFCNHTAGALLLKQPRCCSCCATESGVLADAQDSGMMFRPIGQSASKTIGTYYRTANAASHHDPCACCSEKRKNRPGMSGRPSRVTDIACSCPKTAWQSDLHLPLSLWMVQCCRKRGTWQGMVVQWTGVLVPTGVPVLSLVQV
jgi:hypothetical protein